MTDYNIKRIRQEFKEKGIFYTTKDLAEYLKSFLLMMWMKSMTLPAETAAC